jgi:predicted dehydrogenase
MKIAVLGAGSIGSRHIKNLQELGHSVSIYDPEISGYSGSRQDVVYWADAVVVATPTTVHMGDIEICHKMQTPMFVEKPIVGSYQEWVKVPTDHVKMVGYNLRFHSCVKKAKEWMGEGRIGKPLWARFVCAQHNEKPAYMRDGVILNWSHEIDLAIYLLGQGSYVGGSAFRDDFNGGENIADIILFHDRTKCQSTIHLDYLTKPEQRGFLIAGEDGVIMCDLVQRTIWIKKDNKVVEMYAGQDSWDGNYLDEMRKFIDRLNGEQTIGCTAAEALMVTHLCLEARKHIHVR